MVDLFENDGSRYGYPLAYTAGLGFIGYCEYARAYMYTDA